MEGAVKAEPVNGTPLPQRNKNPNSTPSGGEVEEKKPRFSNPGPGGQGQGGGGQQQQGNENRGGQNRGGQNQNRGGRNDNRGGNRFGGGNRNQNRGGMGNMKDGDIPNLMGDGGSEGGDGGGGGGRGGGGYGGGGHGGGHGGGGYMGNRGDRGGDNRRGGNRGGNRRMDDGDRFGRGKGEDYALHNKLKTLNGPTHELPPIDTVESKFSGRNRLYIGNLTNDVNEEELRELFKPYGEISEAFINAEKNFAFLKVDYHANAERAKRELDGSNRKNRQLRIRFAPNATIVRVKNLTPFVSNELLFKAFEIFGPVERAVIVVDDRGKTTGEGIVEFARKAAATASIRYCTEKCYFLTSSLRPCVVEPFELNDDTDGMPDKSMNKKTQDFYKERQVGPRFAELTSFEHEYGTRWKQLHELFKQKHESLKRELLMEEEKLEAQMEFARYEHETEMLREQLRKREEDRERSKVEWEMRQRQHEEMRTRDGDHMRRQQEDMQSRISRQDDDLRRRQQENTLFMQAQQLNSLLDQQDQQFSQGANDGGGNDGGFNARGGGGGGGGGGGAGGGGGGSVGAGGGTNRNFGSENFGAGNNNAGGESTPNQDQGGFMPGFDFNNQQANQQGGGGNAGNGQQRQGLSRWNERRGGGGGNGGGSVGGNDDFKRRRF